MKTFTKYLRNSSLSLLTLGLTASLLATSITPASAHNVPYTVPYVKSFKLPHDFKVTEKGSDFVMLKGKTGSVMVSYSEDGMDFSKYVMHSMKNVNMMERSEMMKKLEMLKASGMMDKTYMMMNQNHMDHKLDMIDQDHTMNKDMMDKDHMMNKDMMNKDHMMDKDMMNKDMMDKDHMMNKDMMDKDHMMNKDMMDKDMMDKDHMMNKDMMDKDHMMDKNMMAKNMKMSDTDMVYAYATKHIMDVYKNAYIKSIKVEKVNGNYLVVTKAYAERINMMSKNNNLVTNVEFANGNKLVNFLFTCDLNSNKKCEHASKDLIKSIKL